MDNFESLEYRSRVESPDLVANNVTPQQTGVLSEGVYSIMNVSDVDCWIKIGVTANDVTAASGRRVVSGNEVFAEVKEGRKIGALAVTGTVTLEIHKVRSLN